MLKAFNKFNLPALLLNVAAAVLLCLLVNALIFALGWNSNSSLRVSFAPPGWFVGAVWVALFFCMATARWFLNDRITEAAQRARAWTTALLAACLLYPFYALATKSALAGFLGSLATLLLALYVVWRAARISLLAAFFIAPVVLWLLYATAITFAGI